MSQISQKSNLELLSEHLKKVHFYEDIYKNIESIKTTLDFMLENDLIHRDYYEKLIDKLYEFIFV